MKDKLKKINNEFYSLYDSDGNIVASNNTKTPTTKKLSHKNCEAIANGYDLDELAEKEYPTTIDDFTDTGVDRSEILRLAYISGAKAILELLGDKKFSEDDIKKALEFDKFENEFNNKFYESQESFIQSLQQTEWDVEIEMETCQVMVQHGDMEFQDFPKLDKEGCLILKRKI